MARATADSHRRKLPVVDADRATLESADFAAFQSRWRGLPLGVTGACYVPRS